MPAVKKPTKTAKKVTKKTEESTGRSTQSFNGMNGSQIKTLDALKDGNPQTRAELSESTGIAKGWSKILGTKEGGHEDALEPKGYVKSSVPPEGERGLRYTISARGKQALVKAQKEKAKAGKE